MDKPTIHELETLLDNEGRHVRIEPDGSVKLDELATWRRRAEVAEARLRNVIGWRENDWPEGFDRRTAELVAELASPSTETVERRIIEGCQKDSEGK